MSVCSQLHMHLYTFSSHCTVFSIFEWMGKKNHGYGKIIEWKHTHLHHIIVSIDFLSVIECKFFHIYVLYMQTLGIKYIYLALMVCQICIRWWNLITKKSALYTYIHLYRCVCMYVYWYLYKFVCQRFGNVLLSICHFAVRDRGFFESLHGTYLSSPFIFSCIIEWY